MRIIYNFNKELFSTQTDSHRLLVCIDIMLNIIQVLHKLFTETISLHKHYVLLLHS